MRRLQPRGSTIRIDSTRCRRPGHRVASTRKAKIRRWQERQRQERELATKSSRFGFSYRLRVPQMFHHATRKTCNRADTTWVFKSMGRTATVDWLFSCGLLTPVIDVLRSRCRAFLKDFARISLNLFALVNIRTPPIICLTQSREP